MGIEINCNDIYKMIEREFKKTVSTKVVVQDEVTEISSVTARTHEPNTANDQSFTAFNKSSSSTGNKSYNRQRDGHPQRAY